MTVAHGFFETAPISLLSEDDLLEGGDVLPRLVLKLRDVLP